LRRCPSRIGRRVDHLPASSLRSSCSRGPCPVTAETTARRGRQQGRRTPATWPNTPTRVAGVETACSGWSSCGCPPTKVPILDQAPCRSCGHRSASWRIGPVIGAQGSLRLCSGPEIDPLTPGTNAPGNRRAPCLLVAMHECWASIPRRRCGTSGPMLATVGWRALCTRVLRARC